MYPPKADTFRRENYLLILFQEIRSWALLASDRAAEFLHDESRCNTLSESASCSGAPALRQIFLVAFDPIHIARNFDRDALSRKGGSEISFCWVTIAIEAD